MFRLSSCLLVGSANAFTDETSLMQGLKPPVADKQKQDKAAVSNLLESARGMLKNGATDDVTEFVNEVLADIRDNIFRAMVDIHAVEQANLEAVFAEFAAADAQLAEDERRIHQIRDDQDWKCRDHCDCRDDEDTKCDIKVHCDRDLHLHWRGCAYLENELWAIEEQIGLPGVPITDVDYNPLHFCIDNGTTDVFRERSEDLMLAFKAKWVEVQQCYAGYPAKREECETKYRDSQQKKEICDTKQHECRAFNCNLRDAVQQARNEYTCRWNSATFRYDQQEKETRLMMIDRQREYVTLQTVQCLLDRTLERNGRPCDETTNEAQVEEAACERTHQSLDFSHVDLYDGTFGTLQINFPCEMRDCGDGTENHGPILNLGNGTSVSGCAGPLTCPTPQPVYHVPDEVCRTGQIFPGLPSIPEPIFFFDNADEWNSHCFPRDECERCYVTGHVECMPVVWDWDSRSYRDTREVEHYGRNSAHYPDDELAGSHLPLHRSEWPEKALPVVPTKCDEQPALPVEPALPVD